MRIVYNYICGDTACVVSFLLIESIIAFLRESFYAVLTLFEKILTMTCILYTGALNPAGYGVQWFEGKTQLAHRVAYKVANNCSWESMAGYVVMHSCDVRACIYPGHLSLGTDKQNHDDMMAKGRQQTTRAPVGLDDLALARAVEAGTKKADLAREHNVTRAAITYAVKRGQSQLEKIT